MTYFETKISPFLEQSLVPCASVAERNLLADTAKIIKKNNSCKLKDDCRKIVTDGLISLGYEVQSPHIFIFLKLSQPSPYPRS
uniref:Uncharacterized protein n=1 Tax=Nelumbo nucifera TaxID=4432 RepID=A0A822Y247_NELNU|nr:TPA_asm: hypothetical protein HUJ06_029431 [Nelumbo nucifera]